MSRFIASVSALVAGRVAAVVIALVATPVITRLFVPADFGVVSVLVALVTPLVVIGTLRLNVAIVLPTADDDARALAAAAATALLAFCLLLTVLVAAIRLSGTEIPLAAGLDRWLWAAPPVVFLLGAAQIITGSLTRAARYGLIANSGIARAVTSAGSRIGLGAWAGSSVWALLVGFVFGALVQLAWLLRALPRGLRLASYRQTLAQIRSYADFPLHNLPTGLMHSLGQALPLLMLGTLYPAATPGLYAVAVRVVGAPGNIVAQAVQRVFMQRAAAMANAGQSPHRLWLLSTLGMAAIGLLPVLLLVLFGEDLLAWMLGEQWRATGRYAALLSILLLVQWLAAPSTALLMAQRFQRPMLLASGGALVAYLVVFVYAINVQPAPEVTIALIVAVNAAATLVAVVVATARRATTRALTAATPATAPLPQDD